MSEQTYTVGKLVNTHGVAGEAKVVSHTDSPEVRFAKGNTLQLHHPTLKEPLSLEIVSSRQQKNVYIIKFKQFTSINEVEKYKGGILKADTPLEMEEDEFYIHQIVGCQVFTEEGEQLGEIQEVLQPGANDVWVVKRSKQRDLLLPYIDEVVKKVDIQEKKVVVHLLEGLE